MGEQDEGHWEYGVRLAHGAIIHGYHPSDPYLSAQDAFDDNGLGPEDKMMRRWVKWEEVPDGDG